MPTANQLRDGGLSQVSSHNEWWKAGALRELNTLRTCRLRVAHMHDQAFTFEDLLRLCTESQGS